MLESNGLSKVHKDKESSKKNLAKDSERRKWKCLVEIIGQNRTNSSYFFWHDSVNPSNSFIRD